MGAYDAGSAVIAEFLFFLPFILARQYLRTANDNAAILIALVIAGLLYSLPMLFEIRMSPQLSRWIYGYFPGGFITVDAGRGISTGRFHGQWAPGELLCSDSSSCGDSAVASKDSRDASARLRHYGLSQWAADTVQSAGCPGIRNCASAIGSLRNTSPAASRRVGIGHSCAVLSDTANLGSGPDELPT